jgi:6-phosphogluconolactonase (cycloisomerase 2 family)
MCGGDTMSSRVLYMGTDSNRLLVVKLGNNTRNSNVQQGSVVIQDIHPVAPNPLNLPEGVYNGVSTEWISRHPKFPLVYALTSYWNACPARVTTFRMGGDGRLETLGDSSSTGGLHAAHATFSPDGSLYVVAHHNDGKLVFFDCTDGESVLPEDPLLVIESPEVIPGTRRTARPNDPFPGLPSLHHVQYSPNRRFLFTVDPSQDHIFTYTVNERGLPTSQQPTSVFKCYSDVPIYGLFQRLVTKYVLKCKRRARKAVIHPNGKHIYVLYESLNIVQVYNINEAGSIDGSICCQEDSTLDPSFFASRWYPVGLALQLAAELFITKDGSTLLLSNRGDIKLPGSRAESSVRIFSIQRDSGLLRPQGVIPNISGPVRHFIMLFEDPDGSGNHQIVAAVNGSHPQLQCYQAKSSEAGAIDYHVAGPPTHMSANVFSITH